MKAALQAVGLWSRRLQIDRAGPFFASFLPHGTTMRRRIRQKVASAGSIFAFDDQTPTGC
jgi:hypothetical protein